MATWPAPAVTTVTETTRYGTATAWGRLHSGWKPAAGWQDHGGELPVIEGTLIRLRVGHLPGHRDAEPVWLWSSRAGTSAEEVDRTWQAFLRRFDIWSTRSACSSKSWAGPAPSCAIRPPPTGGPG